MDVAKLEYEMKVRNLKVADICKAAKISKSAYYRKLRGASEFTLGEINAILEALGLDSPIGIFFEKKVS